MFPQGNLAGKYTSGKVHQLERGPNTVVIGREEGCGQNPQTLIQEALAKSRLGLGLLIETGTNITIVVGKRHLCPRSECELVDLAEPL